MARRTTNRHCRHSTRQHCTERAEGQYSPPDHGSINVGGGVAKIGIRLEHVMPDRPNACCTTRLTTAHYGPRQPSAPAPHCTTPPAGPTPGLNPRLMRNVLRLMVYGLWNAELISLGPVQCSHNTSSTQIIFWFGRTGLWHGLVCTPMFGCSEGCTHFVRCYCTVMFDAGE